VIYATNVSTPFEKAGIAHNKGKLSELDKC